jgi:hypothetical protein
MDRRERARELISLALGEVEAELRAPRYQVRASELDTCVTTLRGYLAALDRGELPPRRARPEGLCRMVLDSWPYDAPLANAVLQAERAFRNA